MTQTELQSDYYLVLRDPSERHLGRRIDAMSFDLGLKDGHWTENTLVQHIEKGKAKGLHVVRGKRAQWLEAQE